MWDRRDLNRKAFLQVPHNLIIPNSYDSCVRCVLDPYCGWDKEAGSCRAYAPGLLHDATNSTPAVCEASAPLRTVRVGYGQSVHFAAFANTPEVLRDQVVVWYHHSREKGRYRINFK